MPNSQSWADQDPYPYGTWVGGVRMGWWNGRCKRCFQCRRGDGHDPCIANLPGVKAACCGHGEELAYCSWEDGLVIYWEEVDGRFTVADWMPRKAYA